MAEKNSIPQFVNSESIMSDSNYVKWLSDLKGRIRIAQLKAAIKVKEELHKLYWSLGEDICNKQKLYKWGTNFIKQLSLDLRSAFPNVEGFSWSNLYKIRKWYLFYSSQNEFLYQAVILVKEPDIRVAYSCRKLVAAQIKIRQVALDKGRLVHFPLPLEVFGESLIHHRYFFLRHQVHLQLSGLPFQVLGNKENHNV